MKTKLITAVCVTALLLGSASTSFASEDDGAVEVMADTIVVRPCCFVATLIGSVFFVLSLPVATMSKSVKKTARTLVVTPAKATFTRPLGDLDALMEY